jgi:transcription initiation factor TFIIIB Brf1 subunit/transcription initiation factor TFIIB
MKCPSCDSEHVEASVGSSVCSNCGLVLEESGLQAECSFEQQKPSGQFVSHLPGSSYIGNGASTTDRVSSPF